MTLALPTLTSDITSFFSNSTNSKQERTGWVPALCWIWTCCLTNKLDMPRLDSCSSSLPRQLIAIHDWRVSASLKLPFIHSQAQLGEVSSNCKVHHTVFLLFNTFPGFLAAANWKVHFWIERTLGPHHWSKLIRLHITSAVQHIELWAQNLQTMGKVLSGSL